MTVRRIDDGFEAQFVNSRNAHEKQPQSRNLTAARLEDLTREVLALAEKPE